MEINSLIELNRVTNIKMRKIFQPLFTNSPIKVFAYRKYYKDGKYLALCTREDWQEHYFNNIYDIGEVFIKALIESNLNQYTYFLWPNNTTDNFFKELWRYNIWNGISIFYKQEKYVESFVFACDIYAKSANNYFINNLDVLHHYIQHFQLIKEDIKISKSELMKFKRPIFNNIVETYNQSKKIQTIELLSVRERECLLLILKGYTAKSGRMIGIAPATAAS